jgi:hypothetical protein
MITSQMIIGRQPQPGQVPHRGRPSSATSPERGFVKEVYGRPDSLKSPARTLNGSLNESLMQTANLSNKYDVGVQVSSLGQMAYWTIAHTLLLYTFAVVILAGLQTNTIHLTVRALLWIVGAHNVLSFMVLGMHSKLQSRSCVISESCARGGIGAVHTWSRHQRNDRRSILLLLNAGLSFLVTVDLFFVAQIIADIDVNADDFRDTGINMFMNRSLDLVYVFLLLLGPPAVFLVLTEMRFYYVTRSRSATAKVADWGNNDRDLAATSKALAILDETESYSE